MAQMMDDPRRTVRWSTRIEGMVGAVPERKEISRAWDRRTPPTNVVTQRLFHAQFRHRPSRSR